MAKNNLKEVMLGVIEDAGELATSILSRRTSDIWDRPTKYNFGYYTRHKLAKLMRSGLVTFVSRDGKRLVRLTPEGRRELTRYRLKAKHTKRLKRGWWDGKWRVVIFDIKELRRRTRDQLRDELYGFGFRKLQNSVWVTPYDCEEFVILLKADLKVGRDILYLVVEKMEGDQLLREKFNV